MSQLHILPERLLSHPDIYTDEVLKALEALAFLNDQQKALMTKRMSRRAQRIEKKEAPNFLEDIDIIGPEKLKVADIRKGAFECSEIPQDLKRQWVQGTGPAARPHSAIAASIRNVAYALLSGADGWMFDGEDALGQVDSMSLDNQRNLKLAIHRDEKFLHAAEKVSVEMNAWAQEFFNKPIIKDWKEQLDFTTVIFRARGLHLDDRHIVMQNDDSFSASITDVTLYVVNNYQQLIKKNASVVLYLPKIQTAEEAAFWKVILNTLEQHLNLPKGTIKAYVLVEQLEATFQLLEIRAALGENFVGFNTGRWDYINSVADALCGIDEFIHPNIASITMSYAYMAAYEDRVRKAVNTADAKGNYSLWQGGMEPNIPVGSEEGVKKSMKKAIAGANREQSAGASGKWVAHWKMVHIIRPIWEEAKKDNQLGRKFNPLTYTEQDREALISLENAPLTIAGARDLVSVALQYGNAFLQGYQAAALKPADFFGDDDVLYLMEDMATGEIRVSVLWEWVNKKARITESDAYLGLNTGDLFSKEVFGQLLKEEYQKLLTADNRDVHNDSKLSTLPISLEIIKNYVESKKKVPWFIDLLNLNLNNDDLALATNRIGGYNEKFRNENIRLSENPDITPQLILNN
jgi:malate synthase